MHGVAAKIAQKIRVLFKHSGPHAGAPEQIPQHHARRPTPGDTALNVKHFSHLSQYTSPAR
jgi:hypothetical protein